MSFKTTLSTLTGPEEAAGTHISICRTKLPTQQAREVSGKATATNKTLQEVWKNKNEFIKTTKKGLNTQEHYQILRYEAVVVIFLYTEKKQIKNKQNSPSEFKKGESTTKVLSCDGRPFPPKSITN